MTCPLVALRKALFDAQRWAVILNLYTPVTIGMNIELEPAPTGFGSFRLSIPYQTSFRGLRLSSQMAMSLSRHPTARALIFTACGKVPFAMPAYMLDRDRPVWHCTSGRRKIGLICVIIFVPFGAVSDDDDLTPPISFGVRWHRIFLSSETSCFASLAFRF